MKSRVEPLAKQPGFSHREAESLLKCLEQLNVWTTRLIDLPDSAPGLVSCLGENVVVIICKENGLSRNITTMSCRRIAQHSTELGSYCTSVGNGSCEVEVVWSCRFVSDSNTSQCFLMSSK